MKIIFKILAVLSVVLLFQGFLGHGIAQSQEEKLTFGANIRLQYEVKNNFNQLYYGDNPKRGASNDSFLLGRFRAGFDYKPYKNIHLSLGCINSSGKSFRKEELP